MAGGQADVKLTRTLGLAPTARRGENDVQDVAVLDGLVTAMCIKDYRHPKIVSLTPGTGQVDFPVLMTKLIKGGFTHGPLVVETLAPGNLPHLAQEAVKARQFVEKLVAAV